MVAHATAHNTPCALVSQFQHQFLKSTGCSAAPQEAASVAQPDELIDFHHLKARRGMSQLEIEDEVRPSPGQLYLLSL